MFTGLTRFLIFLTIAAMLLALIACEKTMEDPGKTTDSATTTATVTNTTKEKSEGTTETTKKNTTTKEVVENPFAKFYEITWLTDISDDKYVEGAWDELALEEKYNVDFQVWNISNYDREGLAMMLAAGDIPDIGHLPYSPLNQVELYEQGFTRSIHLDMYKKYFPYYYEQMLKNQPSSFYYSNMRNAAGELTEEYYGIPFIIGRYKTYYNWPLMRLDWLDNIGYSIPESELHPINLTDEKLGRFSNQLFQTNYIFSHEDMNEIFRAFTEDDPDGNGEDDTYAGITFNHTWSAWMDLYWGQFGVLTDKNYLYLDDDTGDVVPWYAYKGFREYMEWAVYMRDKGYLRTLPEGHESLAPQGSWYDNLLANWMTGKIGFFMADSQYLCRPDFPEYSDRQPPQSIWLNTDETDATFVTFPVLAGPGEEGTWGTRRYRLDAFTSSFYTVGADVSDDKLSRVLTMWNDRYINEDSDFWRKIIYGIEGIHYKWTGEPWNSGRLKTPIEKVPDKYRRYGAAEHGAYGFTGSFSPNYGHYLNEALAQLWVFAEEQKWTERYTIEPYKYISLMYMGEKMYSSYTEKWEEVGTDISAIINDFLKRHWKVKFLT